jgi:hypothetical protein
MQAFRAILLFSTLAVASACASPASASLFCPVMKTRDGFVALRDAPNMRGKLVARMQPGDEIMLVTSEQQNGWIRVQYWRGDTRLAKGDAGKDGWIHQRFVPPDQCG